MELKQRGSPMFRLGWALATCFILITGILVATTNHLRTEITKARSHAQSLERDLETERRWSAVIAAPAARHAVFVLTPSAEPTLKARGVLDPESRRAIVTFQNITPPGGHDYELWALRGNTPVPLGVVRPDANGRAVLRIPDVGDPANVTAFAVSLEPAGGSPTPAAPTGPIVMIGSLGG